MENNELQAKITRLEQERDKLKAELHSKVDFIQEQRTIINEYAKEIEIYKQCQGKRASKREEGLKQENNELEQENFALTQESQQKSQTICELKQENKELKKQIESQKGLITVGGKQQYEMTMAYDKCKTALEEIRKIITSDNSMIIDKKVYFELQCGEPVTLKLQKIYSRINEVLK